MKIYQSLLFFIFIMISESCFAQEIPVIKYRDLKVMETKRNDTTYVFNFWATWCSPCVKELPHFETALKNFKDEKVKIILVSLDFVRQLNSRLVPFVKDHDLKSTVVMLDEPDYNSWIGKIDSSWSGSIPATLIINNKNGVRKFYEKEFTEEELNKTIQSFIY